MKICVFDNTATSHGNVSGFCRSLAAAFTAEGHPTYLVPAAGMADAGRIVTFLREPSIEAIVTFTGNAVDTNLAADANLYNQTRARLVDLYLDPMGLYIDILRIPIRRRILGCTSPDGLERLGQGLGPDETLRFLPHGADPVERLPWEKRDIPLLFAGNCPETPETIRARWETYPPEIRALLNQASETLLAGGLSLDVAIRDAMAGTAQPDSIDHYRSACIEVDRLMRATVRIEAVTALAELPITIAGEGWAAIERLQHGPARLLGPLPSGQVDELARRSKICVSTTSRYHGSHERVFRAMAAGAVAMATPTDWMTQAIPADCLAMAPAGEIGALAASLIEDDDGSRQMGECGHAEFARAHSWGHRARAILGWLGAVVSPA